MAALEETERGLGPGDDADLVPVLQVRTDPREVPPAVKAERRQRGPRPDPGEHQELRRDVGAGREDDLAAGPHLLGGPRRRPEPLGAPVGPVQALAGQIADADGPQRVLLVEDEARHVAVGTDLQPAGGLGGCPDALARTGPPAVLGDGHGHRDEAGPAPFQHPHVVRVEPRGDEVLGVLRIPEADGQSRRVALLGLDGDLCDRGVTVTDDVADEIEGVGKPGG